MTGTHQEARHRVVEKRYRPPVRGPVRSLLDTQGNGLHGTVVSWEAVGHSDSRVSGGWTVRVGLRSEELSMEPVLQLLAWSLQAVELSSTGLFPLYTRWKT